MDLLLRELRLSPECLKWSASVYAMTQAHSDGEDPVVVCVSCVAPRHFDVRVGARGHDEHMHCLTSLEGHCETQYPSNQQM